MYIHTWVAFMQFLHNPPFTHMADKAAERMHDQNILIPFFHHFGGGAKDPQGGDHGRDLHEVFPCRQRPSGTAGMFLFPERIQGNDRNLFIPGLFQTLYDGIVDIQRR